MVFYHPTIRQKLYLGFGIVIVLMLIVLGYTYLNLKKVSQVVMTNLATYQALRESDGILNSISDIEAGARAYIITGDEKSLAQYESGDIQFLLHDYELRRLLAGNQAQLERLTKLEQKYQEWLAFQASMILQKRLEVATSMDDSSVKPSYRADDISQPGSSVDADSTDLFRSTAGKELRESLSVILDDLNRESQQDLESKSENLKGTEFQTYLSILIGGGLSIIFGILISFFASRSIMKPINMLITATENITKQDYQEPIQLKTDKNLNVLIRNFNSMQVAIQTREEKLTEANRLKSQFLANMSHELRTPLNSIIGFTNRVIKKNGETLPDAQMENLIIVKEQAHHLLELISSLLDYSQLEAGKMIVSLKPFDLNLVISEVNDMIKTLLEAKHLEYQCEVVPTGPFLITGDRIKIKQILINLLSNAIKYSEQGLIRLTVERSAVEYSLCVEDQGIGIASENITTIFEEFRQVDGSNTRKTGGTGLGLSITKNLVELLGGRIEVSSILGQGSRFRVSFPMPAAANNENGEELSN